MSSRSEDSGGTASRQAATVCSFSAGTVDCVTTSTTTPITERRPSGTRTTAPRVAAGPSGAQYSNVFQAATGSAAAITATTSGRAS